MELRNVFSCYASLIHPGADIFQEADCENYTSEHKTFRELQPKKKKKEGKKVMKVRRSFQRQEDDLVSRQGKHGSIADPTVVILTHFQPRAAHHPPVLR